MPSPETPKTEAALRIEGVLLDLIRDGRTRRRTNTVTLESWGETRTYAAFDRGDDTFVFEDGIWSRLENKLPIVVAAKSDLRPGSDDPGHVFTLSTGNHAATSLPLLSGKFWNIADLGPEEMGETLQRRVVCGNLVAGAFELSQREVSTETLLRVDLWLRETLRLDLSQVVVVDRVDETLETYRRLGQEWRIRPLAWTDEEIAFAVRSAQSRIRSSIRYYHNVKGVHALTYPQFARWAETAETKPDAFRKGLEELVGKSADDGYSLMRRPRYGFHHEVEVFGVNPVFSMRTLVPGLEALLRDYGDLDADDRVLRVRKLVEAFHWALQEKDYESNEAPATQHALYRQITGEVYQSVPGSTSPAFDDRRTALPGATYRNGVAELHPGADDRTRSILAYLERTLGNGETLEYVNVYEIRSESEPVPLGRGKARELVYKTSWEPLPLRKIEKRLSQRGADYGRYTMARVRAFRALGIAYGPHRLMTRTEGGDGEDAHEQHYFVRDRYPGESFTSLPRSAFQMFNPATGMRDSDREDPDIVRAVMLRMGGAAAENIILKKRSASGSTIRFAEGKEIIEFGYDVQFGKEMPMRTWLCSIRGTMADADCECDDAELGEMFREYAVFFARVIVDYSLRHGSVARAEIVDAFIEGFSARTREICWIYQSRREQFDAHSPDIAEEYHFARRWRFVLWSLERQGQRLDEIAKMVRAAVSRVGEASR